jgi:hypothetical protein
MIESGSGNDLSFEVQVKARVVGFNAVAAAQSSRIYAEFGEKELLDTC